jgi:hypothetical protein
MTVCRFRDFFDKSDCSTLRRNGPGGDPPGQSTGFHSSAVTFGVTGPGQSRPREWRLLATAAEFASHEPPNHRRKKERRAANQSVRNIGLLAARQLSRGKRPVPCPSNLFTICMETPLTPLVLAGADCCPSEFIFVDSEYPIMLGFAKEVKHHEGCHLHTSIRKVE